jgi:hypothetical protein
VKVVGKFPESFGKFPEKDADPVDKCASGRHPFYRKLIFSSKVHSPRALSHVRPPEGGVAGLPSPYGRKSVNAEVQTIIPEKR